MQPLNASDPILFKPFGKSTEVRRLHCWNAKLPMDVIPCGKFMLLNRLQPEKAPSGIVVMPLGRVTDCRREQLAKTQDPMDVTLSGITREVR